MFMVSAEEADLVRAAYERGGEFSAAVELRRLFPGLLDSEDTRECARTIAGWKPRALPERPRIRRRAGGAPRGVRPSARA